MLGRNLAFLFIFFLLEWSTGTLAQIKKIAAKKRPGRYNIYLNGKYAFPVAESVLVKHRLMKGMELTQEEVAQITTEDAIAQAYGKALDFLSYQLRTESEVTKKLLKEDVPPERIEPVLKQLRANQLLDDQAYAAAYVRTVMNTELKGPTVIRRKLRAKRVGELQIDAALEQFTSERQLENATKLAQKLFRRYAKQPARRQQEKVYQGLITQGYGGDIAKEATRVATPAEPTVDTTDLLDREGEKFWTRYARRTSGYELTMKVKQALFRKGFDYDEIEAWVNQRSEEE